MHKKRKRISKQEIKERMGIEIVEQDERIYCDSNSSVPAICYKCEMIREKYSLQENNESVNDQDIALLPYFFLDTARYLLETRLI
jgi:hypothetical protein